MLADAALACFATRFSVEIFGAHAELHVHHWCVIIVTFLVLFIVDLIKVLRILDHPFLVVTAGARLRRRRPDRGACLRRCCHRPTPLPPPDRARGTTVAPL